jgi:hypothetical protein
MLNNIADIKHYILAGFEHTILCSTGGHDEHYATTPGHKLLYFHFFVKKILFSKGLWREPGISLLFINFLNTLPRCHNGPPVSVHFRQRQKFHSLVETRLLLTNPSNCI